MQEEKNILETKKDVSEIEERNEKPDEKVVIKNSAYTGSLFMIVFFMILFTIDAVKGVVNYALISMFSAFASGMTITMGKKMGNKYLNILGGLLLIFAANMLFKYMGI